MKVGELLAGRSAIRAVPHVAGVRTAQGEELRADLVVDASGRRTRSAQWLEGLAARPPQLYAEDSGFAYYSRYFAGPTRPQRIGRAIAPLSTISIVTLDGDNDTWSVTIFGASGDAPLKALREPATFTRVVATCPLQAHWLDGEPITDVLAMAGILDCYRRFTIDGQPIVTGFAAVGDAWACTNPSAARGLSIGMLHAQHLRAVIRAHLDNPPALARAWDERTQQAVAPFVHDQIAADRVRIAEMDALRDGLPPPAPAQPMARFQAAAAVDLDVFRSLIETVGCTTLPREVLTQPAVQQAMERADPAPPPIPGPDRDTLLQLLAA